MIKPVLISEEGYHRCWFILLEPSQRLCQLADADYDGEKSVFLFLHLIV